MIQITRLLLQLVNHLPESLILSNKIIIIHKSGSKYSNIIRFGDVGGDDFVRLVFNNDFQPTWTDTKKNRRTPIQSYYWPKHRPSF